MTNKDILETAMRQSAIDLGCSAEDFKKDTNVIVESVYNENARKYLELPFVCDLTSYGTNIVASVDMKYKDITERYINRYKTAHCFETPNMHVFDDELRQYGMRVCFMAEYFLPDIDSMSVPECGYELRLLEHNDFSELYLPQWSNALCENRKELDVLGVGAYNKDGTLVGLAACSADCETMYQIGVDVLPEERRRGIGSAVTCRLAAEILNIGKIPFYCCAWANIRSARNAVKCGFRPAWAEMTVKPEKTVNSYNK